MIQAIRGAVRAKSNSVKDITLATRQLVKAIAIANKLKPDQVITIIFTMTDDLDAEFPAYAARSLGGEWNKVPMLCAKELSIKNSMTRVIRVLLLATMDTTPKHQYLGATKSLRKQRMSVKAD